MTLNDRLNERLREITEPIMLELRSVEENIALREEELKELRAGRTRLIAIARQIDPALAPKKQQPTQAASLSVSESKIAEIQAWLKEHVDGDEFYSSGISRRDDFTMSSSQLNKVLNILHERGQIRLIRQGSGGSKYYKIVA